MFYSRRGCLLASLLILPHSGVEREITYKFLEKLARDQSSASKEKVIKTGMERRLL
jgi:hypothetical protein